MKFEFDNNIPIYIQLVEQLKKYIISGKLKCGERLMSVRELALKTQVNPNTMQRALAELESLGLIYTERTNGKFVTDKQDVIDKYKKEYANILTKNYIANMESIGVGKEEISRYIKDLGGEN